MWEVALSNITSKATYSGCWLLFYFIWMKSNIFKSVGATYESVAYTRKISLVHAGLDVIFFLQWLHLHTVIQGTGTKVPFTSTVSFWFLNQNNLDSHKQW